MYQNKNNQIILATLEALDYASNILSIVVTKILESQNPTGVFLPFGS